jgi:hypothetical protein
VPSKVKAAVQKAVQDKRIVVGEARDIVSEVERGAPASSIVPKGRVLPVASLFDRFGEPANGITVTLPARNEFEALFARRDLPYGQQASKLRGVLSAATPKILPAPLARAPSTASLHELPLNALPLLNGPDRTGFYDPGKKRFYVKEQQAGKARWYGPFDLSPKPDPDVGLVRPGSASIAATMTIDGTRQPKKGAGHGLVWLGGLPAGSSVEIQLPGAKAVTLKGPLGAKEKLVAAINKALPPGYFAQGRYVGGHYWEDVMREHDTVREGEYTLYFFKGQPAGGPSLEDLPRLRAMKQNLATYLATSPKNATDHARARWPRWDASARLYRLGSSESGRPDGNALITVYLEPKPSSSKAPRKVAFFDPRQSAVYFGSLAGSAPLIRTVRGPQYLQLPPAGRFFTYAEISRMQAVVNR